MSTLNYAERVEPCVKCEVQINVGELYWIRDGYKRFHRPCYETKDGRKWPKSKITDAFMASVNALELRDQVRVSALRFASIRFFCLLPFRNKLVPVLLKSLIVSTVQNAYFYIFLFSREQVSALQLFTDTETQVKALQQQIALVGDSGVADKEVAADPFALDAGGDDVVDEDAVDALAYEANAADSDGTVTDEDVAREREQDSELEPTSVTKLAATNGNGKSKAGGKGKAKRKRQSESNSTLAKEETTPVKKKAKKSATAKKKTKKNGGDDDVADAFAFDANAEGEETETDEDVGEWTFRAMEKTTPVKTSTSTLAKKETTPVKKKAKKAATKKKQAAKQKSKAAEAAAKVERRAVDISDFDWRPALAAGELDDETVAFIKSILRFEDQKVSGTKAEVFARLHLFALS
jgi:hypothetical protein